MIKTLLEIKKITTSSQIVALVLKRLKECTFPGKTGEDMDLLARLTLKTFKNVKPSFMNYDNFEGHNAFQHVLCVSVNEVLIHGVPNKKPFQEGDLISYDFGVSFQGYHGDGAISFILGEGSNDLSQKLLDVSRNSLYDVLKIIKPGTTTGDIGYFIENYVRSFGFFITKDYCGHGIGKNLHEAPYIPNYGEKGEGVVLKEGMVICIEPMVLATTEKTYLLDDN